MELRLPAAALVAAWALSAAAAPAPPAPTALSNELVQIRGQIRQSEAHLLTDLRERDKATDRLKAIRSLMDLLGKERALSLRRLNELRGIVAELEKRRGSLRERLAANQERVRANLVDIRRTGAEATEALEAPRRKVTAQLVDRSLKTIEALRADLADADFLESKIEEERQQLAYLLQDLGEREELLKFHRRLQDDVLQKRYAERASNLESYRGLKDAEAQVEDLIGQFNARVEFERVAEVERKASRSVMSGDFARLKGSLRLPVTGKVVQGFGRGFDPGSGLHVFRKGVGIDAGVSSKVEAVSAGQVVFAGELPKYGSVLIVDHGAHYYSLCGRLGRALRKKGDWVAKGDVIGLTDSRGTPLYFEIRSRNVAVDPLQWVSD